jgi:preprotein translocase subunit SecD
MNRIFCLLSTSALLLTGCSLFEHWGERPTTLSIHEQVPATLPETHLRIVEVPGFNLKVAVDPFPSLTQLQIRSAEVKSTFGGFGLLLHFDSHGAGMLQQVTTQSRGKYIVVFLNQQPISAWRVDHTITNGEYLIEGYFTEEDAKEAAHSLSDQGRKRTGKYSNLW